MAALGVPDEIIEIILLNLPIKSLFRFKSVSKSWNIMISDHRFIRTHYELSNAKSENSLFVNDDEEGLFSFVRLEGQQLKIEARVWRPLVWRGNTWLRPYKTFLCIGDGLVLLHSDQSLDPNTYVLWNPCTRQETIFQLPYYNSNVYGYSNMYGVCYDPIYEDVKVVIGFKYYYTVYSCKNHSWAEMKVFPCRIAEQRIDGGVSIDGAIYWICHKNDRSKIILCFDSKYDSFKILQKLKTLKDDQCFHLKARKDRLYLCCYEDYGSTLKIWIKEKGGCSWKLLVNIDNLDKARINRLSWVAPLTENEVIIRLGWNWRTYCIYNCCDKSYQEIKADTTLRKRLHPFLGSMFFPAGTKASGD